MCYCQYSKQEWDEKYNDFEPIFYREFVEFIPIPKKIWQRLLSESNHIIRLDMFNSIPKKYFKIKGDE
jgi:hypothetical protein